MKIHIHNNGLHELERKLQSKASKLANLMPFWRSVGEYITNRTIKDCFDKEQSPDGEKWKPLAPATVKRRMKRHKHGDIRILQDTGELRRSIHYEAHPLYVKVGSVLKYARTHQFGRGKIPARPFLAVTQADREHILSMFKIYIRNLSLNGG